MWHALEALAGPPLSYTLRSLRLADKLPSWKKKSACRYWSGMDEAYGSRQQVLDFWNALK
jgi:hypothetical protein